MIRSKGYLVCIILSVFAVGIMSCGEQEDMVVVDNSYQSDDVGIIEAGALKEPATPEEPAIPEFVDWVEVIEEGIAEGENLPPQERPPRVKAMSTEEGDEIREFAVIGVQFTRPMKSVEMTVSGVVGSTWLDSAGETAWFITPSGEMPIGKRTLNVSGEDKQGRELADFTPISFTVVPPPIEIKRISLADGQRVDSNTTITIEFSRKPAKVEVDIQGVAGTVTINDKKATWKPESPMAKGPYSLIIIVRDELGREAAIRTMNFSVA